ncbi:hypothetical protein NMY22_g18494 [Coprinellus aureogranulatus]|nr:hypothetical protein NMY22_g18494 [Coprinellus aureogranulatus]
MATTSSDSTLNSAMSSLNVGSTKPKRTSKLRTGSKKSTTTSSSTTSVDPAGGSSEEPLITAYSQQSRFHRETFDANTTDIDIKGVNISVGQKDILIDAHLRLKAGVKYGMVGQNGVGKSVLMSVLGNNILIGLPQNVRFLHIQQLEEFAPGRTVLQEVLESDVERMRIIREAKLLQSIPVPQASAILQPVSIPQTHTTHPYPSNNPQNNLYNGYSAYQSAPQQISQTALLPSATSGIYGPHSFSQDTLSSSGLYHESGPTEEELNSILQDWDAPTGKTWEELLDETETHGIILPSFERNDNAAWCDISNFNTIAQQTTGTSYSPTLSLDCPTQRFPDSDARSVPIHPQDPSSLQPISGGAVTFPSNSLHGGPQLSGASSSVSPTLYQPMETTPSIRCSFGSTNIPPTDGDGSNRVDTTGSSIASGPPSSQNHLIATLPS